MRAGAKLSQYQWYHCIIGECWCGEISYCIKRILAAPTPQIRTTLNPKLMASAAHLRWWAALKPLDINDARPPSRSQGYCSTRVPRGLLLSNSVNPVPSRGLLKIEGLAGPAAFVPGSTEAVRGSSHQTRRLVKVKAFQDLPSLQSLCPGLNAHFGRVCQGPRAWKPLKGSGLPESLQTEKVKAFHHPPGGLQEGLRSLQQRRHQMK